MTTEYLNFQQIGDTGKTEIWVVASRSSGERLALIKWYGSWRQYTLCPVPGTIWNTGCLESVNNFIRGLMVGRAKAKAS